MNVGFAVEGTSVLSPSLVLSSRAGFIRHDFYIATHGDNFDPGTLGFPSSFTSQLQVRLESFNLFNTPSFGAPNTNVTNAAFGTVAPTQANDPRNVQIGIRFMF